ncbi:MAG: hypothetical protein QQN63_06835 [Nitrosopumilus sp.]
MRDEFIYLLKNTAPEGKTLHEKAPVFRMVKREEDGSWTELAGCWKTKSGTGLSCKLQEGVSVTIQDVEKMNKDIKELEGGSTDEIIADDIPF